MTWPLTDRELKRGSATLLVLALVDETPRHGYEIGKLIETRSGGTISFQMASLYPLLYRLERRGWILGEWREAKGERRRRFYRITPAGRTVLADQRGVWQSFVRALDQVAGLKG
ncbi:MAG: helix-turn-helix transcriptional regulator [Vicinamibacterales bacterium]